MFEPLIAQWSEFKCVDVTRAGLRRRPCERVLCLPKCSRLIDSRMAEAARIAIVHLQYQAVNCTVVLIFVTDGGLSLGRQSAVWNRPGINDFS